MVLDVTPVTAAQSEFVQRAMRVAAVQKPSERQQQQQQLMISPRSRPRPEAGFTTSYLIRSPPRTSATASSSSAVPMMRPPHGGETICHGLFRDPSSQRSEGWQPSQPVPMPDPFVFYTWWNEEVATPVEFTPSGQGMGVRRQVRLHYLPQHGSFQLFTDDANAPLTIVIEHADGSPCAAAAAAAATRALLSCGARGGVP